MKCSFEIPIKVESLNVKMGRPWQWTSRERKNHRWLGKTLTNQNMFQQERGLGSFKVTLTRIGKRMIDDDNCAGAFKAIRDGIAEALGINDGSNRLTWIYRQEKSKQYSVRVEIEKIQ